MSVLAGTSDDPIVQRGLELLRGRLDVPVAFFTEITAGHEVLRQSDAAPGERVPPVGTAAPLEQTYCGPMVSGEVPRLIPDVSEHPRLFELPATEALAIGAYVGSPVVLPDGQLLGALCVLAHEPRPDLREHHATLVSLVADLVADNVARGRETELEVQAQAASALLASLGERDPYTAEHSEAVVDLVGATGMALGLPDADVAELCLAALVHDVGKVGVPDAVLLKAGELDAAEWEAIRRHPTIGGRLLRGLPSLARLAPVVEAEHERWDGTGYPAGLAGEAIPLAARIILVCDAYDAMVTDRVYRPAMAPAAAIAELEAGAGTQFDPAVVAAFKRAR